MTPLDIITLSLKDLGVLGEGETPSAEAANDALTTVNALLDQWSLERLMICTVTRTTWTITSGTQTYSVGTGSTVNTPRPVHIQHVQFQDTSISPTLEYQMQPLTEDAYSKIPQKTLSSTYPTSWYYNPTIPTGTLTLWPKPTSSNLQGVLYAWTAIAQFTSLSQTISLPPGYQRLITKNLALELAPSYEKQPSPVLVDAARDSKMAVKRMNTRLMDANIDAAALIQGARQTFVYDINVGP